MASPSSSSAKSYYDFTAGMPEDVHHLIEQKALHEHLRSKIFFYQSLIVSKYGPSNHHIAPMGIHPEYPFARLYRIEQTQMPEEVLCFLWYLCSVYTIGITFDIPWLYNYINAQQDQKECLSTFLTWFAPLTVWSGKMRRSISLPFKKLKSQGSLNPFFNPHSIFFFHRPVQYNSKTGKIHALPTLIHHKDFYRGVRPDFNVNDNKHYEDFQLHAFRLNNARQTFPVPFIPNWTYYSVDYQMSLDEDLQFYMERMENMAIASTAPKPEQQDIKQEESQPDDTPQEYFQDAQLPDDSMDMNIDEVEKRFGININTDSKKTFEEPEPVYKCPDDGYECCEEHILEFEMDH